MTLNDENWKLKRPAFAGFPVTSFCFSVSKNRRRTMNRAKGILTGTLLLAGLAAVGGKLGAQLPPPVGERGAMALGPGMDVQFATKVVKGAPFSAQAVTEINQTLSDGNQIHRTASSALCRDSEGRTRREETLGVMGPWISPQGGSEHLVLINDPVAGTHC
jgi:hypothetical protein